MGSQPKREALNSRSDFPGSVLRTNTHIHTHARNTSHGLSSAFLCVERYVDGFKQSANASLMPCSTDAAAAVRPDAPLIGHFLSQDQGPLPTIHPIVLARFL